MYVSSLSLKSEEFLCYTKTSYSFSMNKTHFSIIKIDRLLRADDDSIVVLGDSGGNLTQEIKTVIHNFQLKSLKTNFRNAREILAKYKIPNPLPMTYIEFEHGSRWGKVKENEPLSMTNHKRVPDTKTIGLPRSNPEVSKAFDTGLIDTSEGKNLKVINIEHVDVKLY